MTSSPPPRGALISGGTRGLGLAIARALLRDGCRIAAFSRRKSDEFEAFAAAHPSAVFFREADLTDADGLRDTVAWAEESAGPLGILVNNAGVAHEALLARQSPDWVDRVIEINLGGTLALTRLAIRGMMVRGSGRIISISSIAGLRGFTGTAAYAASKGAIDAMTRALARELGGRNITVNAVAPGYMHTEMTRGMTPGQLRALVRRTPLGRVGTVEDVAGLVAFLASDRAAFISGQTIVVDGGLTC
jgi:3-oxoacyl-[acyl-carrier protein] reductase